MRYAISFSYNKYLFFLPSCEVQGVRGNQAQIPLLLHYHYITTICISSSQLHSHKTIYIARMFSPKSLRFPFPAPPSPHHTKKQSWCQYTASGMWQFPLSAKLFHTFNSEVKILS